MKMFLASQGIPLAHREKFLSLFARPASEIKIAFIPDAATVYSDEEKYPWYENGLKDMKDLGVQVAEVSLSSYEGQTLKLAAVLSQFDGLWISGGNTFYLRYWMKASGFDQIIRPLMQKGLVYGGYSAGAEVTGPTIKYVDLDGEKHQEPERIEDGLQLIDQIIVPHWNQENRRDYLAQLEAAYAEDNLIITPLCDDQALLCLDGAVEYLK